MTLSPLGIHFIAIGDSLHRYWGFTSSLLGIHPTLSPLKPQESFNETKKVLFLHFFLEKTCI
jgi:hypothetical protein